MLTLIFGDRETSDFWGDALKLWWSRIRRRCRGIRKLVIYLDNGPKNSGVTRKFLRSMIAFSDWSGLELHLVYYPPYHSKYNPIERCWSSLQKKWNGVLLTCWQVVYDCACRMTWKKKHPAVFRLENRNVDESPISRAEQRAIEMRLQRSETLGKYDITIKPKSPQGQVNCHLPIALHPSRRKHLPPPSRRAVNQLLQGCYCRVSTIL